MYSKKDGSAKDLSRQITFADQLKPTTDNSLLVAIQGEEFHKYTSIGSNSNHDDTWIGSIDSSSQNSDGEASIMSWDSAQLDENSLLDEDEKLLDETYLLQDYESNIDW